MFKLLIKNVLLKASVFAFLVNYSSHLSIVVFGHLCFKPRMKMLQLCVVFVVNSATLPLHPFVYYSYYYYCHHILYCAQHLS